MGTVMEERVKKMLGGNLKCEPRETLDIRGEGLRKELPIRSLDVWGSCKRG